MKAVLFDLDRTLLDRDTALTEYAKGVWASWKNEADQGRESFLARFIQLDARGRGDKRATFQALASEFFQECDARTLHEEFEYAFPNSVLPFPDAIPLLSELRRNGVLVGVVSNGRGKFQRAKLANAGLLPLIDVVVISEEIGCKKPDPRIFRFALNSLSCRPEEVMFVGDLEEADIQGSKAIGMLAVLRRYPGDTLHTQAHRTITALSEVQSIVRSFKEPNHPV